MNTEKTAAESKPLKAYTKPSLTVHGSLATLTRGPHGVFSDSPAGTGFNEEPVGSS